MGEDKKRLRFRNGGKFFIGGVVDISGGQQVGKGSLRDIAVIRVRDPKDNEVIGGVIFRMDTWLFSKLQQQEDFMGFTPPRTTNGGYMAPVITATEANRGEFLEEILVNLLHYLPFYPDKIRPIYEKSLTCFAYNFERHKIDALINEREHDILTADTFEKTMAHVMFQDDVTDEKIRAAILEILYVQWRSNADFRFQPKQIYAMVPASDNDVRTNLEMLAHDELIEMPTNTDGKPKWIKILPKGVQKVEGTLREEVPHMTKTYNGPVFETTTHGDHSPITITIDTITTTIGELKKEVEKKNEENKTEVLEALTVVEEEAKDLKNPSRFWGAIETLKKGAAWTIKTLVPIATEVAKKELERKLGLPM